MSSLGVVINRRAGPGACRLANENCAASGFEGIRSEDIPGALARQFTTILEHRRDCFLWRLVDGAYAGNYDLASKDDLRVLRGWWPRSSRSTQAAGSAPS